jgi:bacterioferritin-associated ferredoxin
VTIGGKAATFTVISDTEVKATVPAGAKNGQKICIATAGGTACGGTFTVAPNILSFSPSSGSVGTTVTITGTTFTGTTKVTFGGVAATSFQVISDSEVKALVPTGAKTGKIQVTTPGGTATSATNFTVT